MPPTDSILGCLSGGASELAAFPYGKKRTGPG
jgi:hypothetical protein